MADLLDDRIVLRMKADFCRQYGRTDEPFASRLAAVEAELSRRKSDFDWNIDPVTGELPRLEEIHGQLWHHLAWSEASGEVTDENCHALAQLAVRVASLLRERAAVLDGIDMTLGEFRGPRWVSYRKS